nr:hypothetical protein BaRGS_028687 [Batillaria attramentaria]
MRICFGLLVVAVVALVVALIAVVVVKNNEIDDLNHEIDDLNNEMDHLKMNKSSRATSWPCPPKTGGLMTEGEPATPEPFHDITVEELERLYDYLLTVTELNLKPPSQTSVNTASIFMVDLHLPPKADVLRYLDGSGARPPREAKVMVFRGDLSPPVVEEYRVGPLSKPNYIHLMNSGTHRNPVEFAVRPIGNVEFISMFESFVPVVDNEIREVLLESYGGTLTNCGDNCLKAIFITASTGVLNEKRRKYWAVLTHPAEYYHVYPLDIAILLDVTGSNTSQWRVDKIWYAGAYYNSTSELVTRYKDTQQPINKTRVPFVRTSPDLPSTQNLRGDAVPDPPQRPPVQVEPDGKRYTIHHRHVRYLHWDFDFRMSSFHGPQLYDVKFQGERIAYEVGLSELAVFYSSNDPAMRYMDFVDGGVLIGTHSKTLAPGTDCPESATYVPTSFLGEAMNKPVTFGRGFCVFEHNNGIPLRRHASYSWVEGAYYAGMADSVLVVRSILTIVNYDYVVDFVFHQNGVLEVRAASTGSIIGSFYRPDSAPYGFHIDENLLGNVHQHVFHFKADLDILGTANRYETLDITAEEVDKDPMGPNVAAGEKYSQIRFDKKLYNTEMEALYRYNFDQPKYHIVHNNQNTTKYGVPRAYRLHMGGMSKQLLAENQDNERTASWARHQMAVTVRKDEEEFSSSAYAMFDSIDPVVNFADFYSDNESIVDQVRR